MTLKRIPIARAKEIAKKYGYNQVIIIARNEIVPDEAVDWITTYGKDKRHCDIAHKISKYLMKCLYEGPPWRKKPATSER